MFELFFFFLGDGPMQQSDSFKQQQIQKIKKTFWVQQPPLPSQNQLIHPREL